MADDTKKVLIPKDRNGDDRLDNDFTAANANYGALPGFGNSGQDDLPLESPQPVDNVEQVSLGSARQKVLNDTRINPRQPGPTDTLRSPTQFLPDPLAPSTVDRPGPLTLGSMFNKGLPGIRKPITDPTVGASLRDIDTESQSLSPQNSPQGRTVAGTPGPAYGNPDEQPGAGETVRRTVSAVLSRNRFAGMSKRVYAPANSDPDEQVIGSFQSQVGGYDSEAPTAEPTQAGYAFSLETLKDTAAQLISQASGFSTQGRETNRDQRYASEGVAVSSIRPRNLQEGSITNDAFIKSKASTGEFDEPDDGAPVTTFGQLNTPDSPYAGLNPAQMKALADAIITATVTALDTGATNTFINQLTSRANRGVAPGSVPYTKGKFIEKADVSDAALRTDLGFAHTSFPYNEAIEAGKSLVFGIEDTPIVNSSIGERAYLKGNAQAASSNVANNPGFYVTFCRAVLRDAQNLQEKFAQLSSAAQGSSDSIIGATTLIDAFRSSKVVACMNVLAMTGDSILSRAQSPYKVDQLKSSGDPGFTPFGRPLELPGLHYRPSSHAMKSRDSDTEPGQSPSSMRLAWRNSSAPSLYLLPAEIEYGSVQNTLSTFSNDSPAAAHISMEGITKASSGEGSGNRLPQEFVENHERILDAEYVPFYFHDLRTGEIIAFHAFLDNLSDNFSARYSPQKAIGRAEAVQIYDSTERDISFSFYVAATSREDFNEMWFKINKLITMLYPQYTQGRQVKDESGGGALDFINLDPNFIMPFSQVQAASPMIRLRIGDVIKTNFSKFNLSRLFGLGTEQFAPTPIAETVNKGTLMVMRILFQGLGLLANTTGAGRAASSVVLSSGAASVNFLEIMRLVRQKAKLKPDGSGPFYRMEKGLKIGDVVRISFPSVRTLNQKGGPGKLFIPFKDVYANIDTDPVNSNGDPTTDKKGDIFYAVRVASTPDLASMGMFDVSGETQYLLNHHDASLIPLGLKKEFFAINGMRALVGVASLFAGAIQGQLFLSSFNNAVARSFDQSSGKGLPGFVTSIGFDWIGSDTTWEVDQGSRAPKIAKITCRFKPVHDIAPGLDHLGYNRAPVYPVGDVMNEIVGTSGDLLDSQLAQTVGDAIVASGGEVTDGISSDILKMKLGDES